MQKDSVHIHDTVTRTVWRTDTSQVVTLQKELARVYALIGDTARAETSAAVAMAWLDDRGLKLELHNKDSVRVEVPVYHERQESRHEEVREKTVTETVTVTEYCTPGIVAAAAWFGLAALLWIVIRAVLRICLRR